jgi:hypothetical protein
MREKIYAVARFGKEGKSDAIIPKLGQEVLAENGPIYNGGVRMHSSLLSIVLHD